MKNAQIIKKLLNEIEILRKSCREGFDGSWEPSPEGFVAMEEGCVRAAKLVRKFKCEPETKLVLAARCALADLEGLVFGTEIDPGDPDDDSPVAKTIRELRSALADTQRRQ